MKSATVLRAVLPLAALLVLPAAAATQDVARAVQLTGSFNWNGRKGKEDLQAVLTPSGTNAWTAVFTFNWDRSPHTWNGTVTGHLDHGDVQGEAKAEGGKRAFLFRGHANNRVLTFNHFETTGGRPMPTGAGTLKPDAGGGKARPGAN